MLHLLWKEVNKRKLITASYSAAERSLQCDPAFGGVITEQYEEQWKSQARRWLHATAVDQLASFSQGQSWQPKRPNELRSAYLERSRLTLTVQLTDGYGSFRRAFARAPAVLISALAVRV